MFQSDLDELPNGQREIVYQKMKEGFTVRRISSHAWAAASKYVEMKKDQDYITVNPNGEIIN